MRQRLLAVEIGRAVLLRPRQPQGHRVDELQVAGVEAERQIAAPRPTTVTYVVAVAQVVLHVAAAAEPLRVDVLELAEDLLRALADDVGQHVQPAAVRHAHARSPAIPCWPAFSIARSSSGIRLSAPSRENVFAPTYLRRTNSSKITASVSRVRIRSCSLARELQPVLGILHAPLKPVADSVVVDVHELHADVPAVGILQTLENRAQRLHVGPGRCVVENGRSRSASVKP